MRKTASTLLLVVGCATPRNEPPVGPEPLDAAGAQADVAKVQDPSDGLVGARETSPERLPETSPDGPRGLPMDLASDGARDAPPGPSMGPPDATPPPSCGADQLRRLVSAHLCDTRS